MGVDLRDIEAAARALAASLGELPEVERVEALNTVRTILAEVSPMRAEPVDLVLWVPSHRVRANDYNPNAVAPPEMRLLARSVELDGYTQPIVAVPLDEGDGPCDVVVDGFHRHRVGKEVAAIAERVRGYLPVVRLATARHNRRDLMAATIRHNRARGRHGVERMAAIVGEMSHCGWKDPQIQAELGMEEDEVLRLKQISSLAALFAEAEFSEAWEPEEGR